MIDRQRELNWDIDGGRSIQLSFGFRSDDGYGSNMAELASSFIRQYPVRTGSKEELLQPMAGLLWTERRLWSAFRSLLCRAPPHRLIVLLGSFENCKQSDRWFLQDLAHLASNAEWRLKIICTNNGTTEATEVIKEAKIKEHHMDLDEMIQEPDKLHDAAHDMLETFLRTNIVYKAVKTQLIEKLGDPSPEKLTGMLILLRYLESADISTTREQMLEELESFPTINPTDVITTILKKVPAARRPWAHRILTWIRCGCRPLTASELAVASALDRKVPQSCALENTIYNDVEVDISRSPLGSVLEFDCGRIRFVDNHVVDVITDKANRNWYTLPSNPDWMLCLTCVSYLRVNGVRNASQHLHYIELRGIFASPADKEYLGLLEYAVKYWPVHYRRATLAGGTDDNAIINFFQDIDAIQSWSELHWYLQSGFHKQWQGLNSLTRLQLSAFLRVPVAKRQLKQQTDSKELESAMATAARRGNNDLVDLVVGSMKTRGNVFEAALVDAAHTGNGAILLKLLSYFDRTGPCSTLRNPAAVHMKTLLYLSSENGLTECLGHLVKLCRKQNILIDREHDRQKLLLSAAANGQDKFVRQLFQDLFPKGLPGGYGGDWSYTPLHVATAGGHASIVEYIRDRSGYVEAKERHSEETALHVAARAGFTNIADKLLRYKSKIDAPDARGRIPLHLACMNGFKSTSKRLISTQNIADHEGNTAIHHAARGGHMGVINLFRLDKNDLLVKTNEKLENPLHIALKEGNELASRCFVKAYQEAQDIDPENNSIMVRDFNAEDGDGETPLTLALRRGFEKLALDIIMLDWKSKQRRVIMDSKHEDQIMVAFALAAECGYIPVMEELLRRHRKVCMYKQCIEQAIKDAAKNGRSHTLSFLLEQFNEAKEGCGRKLQEEAFLNAASSGDLGTVRVLLDHGVEVNIQDEYNNTALGLAAYYGRADVARLLLLRKADTRKSDFNGETPLSDAASEDSYEVAELLLDAGASVDAQNKRRETPLVRAIRSGNSKIVKLLLQAGADMDIADNGGDNALCHAVRLGDIKILELLLDRRPGIEALQGAAYLALEIALEQSKTQIMRALLIHARELFLESWKLHRWSPLQAAAYRSRLDIVDLLLEHDAEVNGTGGQFYTALQAAAYGDRTAGGKLTRRLLHERARTDLYGGTFGTALHAAASRPDKGEHSPKYTIARMLINRDKGLRDRCDSHGRLPLHLAAFCDDWEMMMLVKPVDRNHLLLRDRLGRTPLHFAAAGGSCHVMKQILDVCANANDDPRNQTDCDGWTPLHWACRAGSETAIKSLMTDPRDLIKEANEGCTPVSIACSHGHAKTMATVLQKELPEAVSQINYDAEECHKGYSCDSCLCVSWQLY
jgi:ankyrin repeat protein